MERALIIFLLIAIVFHFILFGSCFSDHMAIFNNLKTVFLKEINISGNC